MRETIPISVVMSHLSNNIQIWNYNILSFWESQTCIGIVKFSMYLHNRKVSKCINDVDKVMNIHFIWCWNLDNHWEIFSLVYHVLCIKSPLIQIVNLQYIPRNMHTVFALLCFVVVIHWLIFPYPSGLLHWHCGNLTIAPVPAKQPWWIWINTSCEFIMHDCITTTKQSTTKPCAYFMGYTVWHVPRCICIIQTHYPPHLLSILYIHLMTKIAVHFMVYISQHHVNYMDKHKWSKIVLILCKFRSIYSWNVPMENNDCVIENHGRHLWTF